MYIENINKSSQKIEFNSIDEFYKYITETPLNETFRWKSLRSVEASESFTMTSSFEQASSLLKNGWTEMAQKLTNKLKVEGKFEKVMGYKNIQSVQGFHPIVPLYLMGIPNNMVNKQLVPMKQKVVTIDKCLNYSFGTKADKIVEESVKALRIIQKLESQNYRVNLNLIIGVTNFDGKTYYIKIKLKGSNEKLNISKLSFPLVHPSMLRRMYLRFIEVHPGVPKSYEHGYGSPLTPDKMREAFEGDIVLPQFINKDIESIKTLDDLEKL